MESTGLVKKLGRWILPVEGREVSRVKVDVFHLLLGHVWIRIETPFDVSGPGGTVRIDPRDKTRLRTLLDLENVQVKSGVARMNGLLRLEFADGRRITVPPHDQFEAWEATTDFPPDREGFTLVALPGGGLAVF